MKNKNKTIGKAEKINGTVFLANLLNKGSKAAKRKPDRTAIIINAG